MRVVLFFLVAIGGLLFPVAAAVVALLLAPFPYERIGPAVITPAPAAERLHRDFAPDSEFAAVTEVGGYACRSGMRGQWADGTALGIASYELPSEGDTALENLFRLDRWSLTSRTNAFRYTAGSGRTSDGRTVELFAWTEGSWLFWLEAPDSAALERRIAALPFLRPRASKPLIDRLFGEQIGLLLGIFAGYLLLLVPVWTRVASWAATQPPRPGVAPVPAAELRRRLLALDRPDQPYRIAADGPWIVAEWKIADRRWVDLMSANRLSMVHRVRMRLDEDDHTVRNQDHQGSVSWSTGPLGLAPEIAWSVSRGIVFAEYHVGLHPGFSLKDGRVTFDSGAWRFHLRELKDPITAIVADSGWTWRPVLSFLSRALFG